MAAKILLTGGAGYIGSHTYVALAAAGYDVVILDNFSNAKGDVPDRLELITGRPVTCVRGDVGDADTLEDLFAAHDFDAVVHFAARKAVGESVRQPLDYARTNIGGLMALLQVMEARGVRRLVFSSTATVYGVAQTVPTPETAPLDFTSPYAFTKLSCEHLLRQMAAADPPRTAGSRRR